MNQAVYLSGKRVLVVEDDLSIARLIELHLRVAGLQPELCNDGSEAMRRLADGRFHAVILDRMLPGHSGMQILRWLNQRSEARPPVLMVTAMGATADKVQGLNEGADDYLSKPFEPEELLARLNALLRRAQESGERLLLAGIDLRPDEARVIAAGREIELRALEFKLLHTLMRTPNKVFSRQQLLDQVWGRAIYVEERTVDVTIKRLRQALAAGGCDSAVETVRGMGYRFAVKREE